MYKVMACFAGCVLAVGLITFLCDIFLEGEFSEKIFGFFQKRYLKKWHTTKAKNKVIKKIKVANERFRKGKECFVLGTFAKALKSAAPNIWDYPSRFLEVKYTKEKEQAIEMFKYILAVIEKYPLIPKAKNNLLSKCLDAFDGLISYGDSVDLTPHQITFNGFIINQISPYNDYRFIALTDITKPENENQPQKVRENSRSELYKKASSVLLREIRISCEYKPKFKKCGPGTVIKKWR